MKIAVIHWGYPPVIGGVETHLAQLCPALVRCGHKVSLLTGSHEESRSSYVDRGVWIKRLPIMDLNWLYRRGFAGLRQEIEREVALFLDKSRAEIVHAHNMSYFSPIHARALQAETARRHIPLVLTAHNTWDDAEFMTLTRTISWDHIIAVSHYIKMELIGCGISPRDITVVHHGIDGKQFFEATPKEAWKKYPMLKGKKVIFHPARLGLAKGCAVSVRAFRLVKARIPNAFLVMAGTKNIIDWGAYQQKEIAYIVQLLEIFNLQRDTLIDHYPLEFMPAMYAASDVCLYPSIFSEPFGLVMLEAMAAAKPIIVSRAGGMPEIIKSRVNGFVVPPRDHIVLAKTIIRLLEHPELYRQVAKKGREVFQQKYYLERMVDQILAVYQKEIEKKKKNQLRIT